MLQLCEWNRPLRRWEIIQEFRSPGHHTAGCLSPHHASNNGSVEHHVIAARGKPDELIAGRQGFRPCWELEAYSPWLRTFRTAARDRPKCLATCPGATPARRAARTALRFGSCRDERASAPLTCFVRLACRGTRLSSTRAASWTAWSSSGWLCRPALSSFRRVSSAVRSFSSRANRASGMLVSSGRGDLTFGSIRRGR